MAFIQKLIIISVLCGSFFIGSLFFILQNTGIDFSVLEQNNSAKPSILLDDEGNEWARFTIDRKEPIALEQMPVHLINAFISAEDHTFFSHYGISIKGMLRSLLVNLYKRRIVQGASTITQQLVKLLFVGSQRKFLRKIKEQILSLIVEYQFSKEQILQTYLNHVYFGCGIYGVEAASRRYWGISACDLTVPQAATLAANVNSPAMYCPLLCPLSCKERRNLVLRSMYKQGYISFDEYETYGATELLLTEYRPDCPAPYLKEMIRLFVEQMFGIEMLYTGGLQIQTTLNQEMQRCAQDLFQKQITQLRSDFNMKVDGALLTIDVVSGDIKTLIGGFDFQVSKFNRVTQAKRQIGSSIKPLLYASALMHGKTFADTQIDEPLSIQNEQGVWQPRNYSRKFEGQMTLAHALSHSNNIVTIKTLLSTGAQTLVKLLKDCNLIDDITVYPSLALGCIDCSLYNVTAMFNIFANKGIYVEPSSIKWIKDEWGMKIYKSQTESKRVLAAQINDQVAKVLGLSFERAKKRFGNDWISSQAISKTGTTNDSRTVWFLGSTPEYTTGIYLGCDDNSSLGQNVFPVRTAFPIWASFYKRIKLKKEKFSFDISLKEITIDAHSGVQTHKSAQNAISILVPEQVLS